ICLPQPPSQSAVITGMSHRAWFVAYLIYLFLSTARQIGLPKDQNVTKRALV
uniref:Uncharacterized protein n=1 Tax=Piliocolobus tephrosceles TaxID=591936 RepID=A0A8C9H7V1_9PRIM